MSETKDRGPTRGKPRVGSRRFASARSPFIRASRRVDALESRVRHMVRPRKFAAWVRPLAIARAMLKLNHTAMGEEPMSQTGVERARIVARNLVELLTSYEEE